MKTSKTVILALLFLSSLRAVAEDKIDTDSIADSLATPFRKEFTSDKNDTVSFFKPREAIRISIFPDTTMFLNGIYRIDHLGYIDLPYTGLIKVKDLSREEFIDFLKKNYSDFLRFPNIHITPLMRVSLTGGFKQPGLFWVDTRSSLWDVVQIAGGPDRRDGISKIHWKRNGELLSKNIIGQFQTGASLKEMGFISGDQLSVTKAPKKEFWDSFKGDFIPLFTLLLTTVTTSITVYQTYKLLSED